MKITLTTNLPDNTESLISIIKIIKFANLMEDVGFRVAEYGEKTEVELSALNNVILSQIIKEIEND